MQTPLVEAWVWKNSPDWSSQPHGQNFLAKIRTKEDAPGGIEREFQPRAKGMRGFVIRSLSPGDPIEVGSYTTDASGTVKKNRAYFIVKVINRNGLDLIECPDADTAIRQAQERVNDMPTTSGAIPTLQRRLLELNRLSTELDRQKAEIQEQLRATVQAAGDNMDLPDNLTDEAVGEIMPDPPVPSPGLPESMPAKTLPLHRLQLTPNDDPETDDEEVELTPAQIRALTGS